MINFVLERMGFQARERLGFGGFRVDLNLARPVGFEGFAWV